MTTKVYLIIVLITFTLPGNCQSLKSQLIGSWVKLKTETLDEKDTCGNYGLSNDYLRFSFTKKKISFARAPWDMGDEMNYIIDHDTIETPMHNLNYVFQETYYYIEKINDTDLILLTTFDGKTIRYILKNQSCFKPEQFNGLYQFDNDTIVIVRIPDSHFQNHYFTKPYSFESATERFFLPRPIYKNNTRFFKEYICYNLRFKEPIEKDVYSKPIKVSFLIDNTGKVSEIKLLKGFIEYYDKQIIKLIKKTNKKWIPTIIEAPNIFVKMTYTFIIIDKSKSG
jgi:hypothetical protein